MGKSPTRAALLLPPKKKANPLNRAEAELKLAEVLGKGDRDLFARYVRKRTLRLSISQLRLLANTFAEGDQYDFERKLERYTCYTPSLHREGKRLPILFE